MSKSIEDAVLPAGVPLIAIVDEKCVSERLTGNFISDRLRLEIKAQPALSTERAYSLQLPTAFTRSSLKTQAEADACLINLSEDAIVTRQYTPNDPRLTQQLHLVAIDAITAWDGLYANLTGNTVIAIIDDGLDMAHPDLSGVLWNNPDETAGNNVDEDGNGYIDDFYGYNFSTGIPSPAHQNGASHGTHVAGLAAAQGNNSIGITGVMGRNAKIMVLNVFGLNNTAGGAAIINAINYAKNKGAHVINMSLGGKGAASAVRTAMVNAVAAGTFIAAAAGNDDTLVDSGSNFYMPMGYAKDILGAISVGSTDATTGLKSSFSNYSTTYVEMSAPGSNSGTGGVMSTYPTSSYNYLQGTSMASPVLAGAAALLIGWGQAKGHTFSPADVEAILKTAAVTKAANSTYFQGGAALSLTTLITSAECQM